MGTGQVDYRERLSGWWAFAGTMMLIVGGFNLIEGIAALAQKSYFNESGLIYTNLRFWGWWLLIIGIVQLLTSFLIYARSEAGAVIGIFLAAVSAFFAFFAIGAYPWWALTILVVDGLVIYGLTRAASGGD
jgi:hypothetical protein